MRIIFLLFFLISTAGATTECGTFLQKVKRTSSKVQKVFTSKVFNDAELAENIKWIDYDLIDELVDHLYENNGVFKFSLLYNPDLRPSPFYLLSDKELRFVNADRIELLLATINYHRLNTNLPHIDYETHFKDFKTKEQLASAKKVFLDKWYEKSIRPDEFDDIMESFFKLVDGPAFPKNDLYNYFLNLTNPLNLVNGSLQKILNKSSVQIEKRRIAKLGIWKTLDSSNHIARKSRYQKFRSWISSPTVRLVRYSILNITLAPVKGLFLTIPNFRPSGALTPIGEQFLNFLYRGGEGGPLHRAIGILSYQYGVQNVITKKNMEKIINKYLIPRLDLAQYLLEPYMSYWNKLLFGFVTYSLFMHDFEAYSEYFEYTGKVKKNLNEIKGSVDSIDSEALKTAKELGELLGIPIEE